MVDGGTSKGKDDIHWRRGKRLDQINGQGRARGHGHERVAQRGLHSENRDVIRIIIIRRRNRFFVYVRVSQLTQDVFLQLEFLIRIKRSD